MYVGGGTERKASSVSDLEMEVSKLRAENARLKMEKEILKKATAFFVKESQ
jgi:transposase